MEEGSSGPWYSTLEKMIQSPKTSDDEIVDFIERAVPSDESHIFDCKMEAYVSATDDDLEIERRAELAETLAALANVDHKSQYRYLFVGFDDEANFVKIENRGSKGGQSVLHADDQKIQNILRDYVEPVPNVEKHRLQPNGDNGVVLLVEKISSAPIVITESVNANGSRVITEGIAPTRRSSETTHMSHSDFRNIVEHREDVISEVLNQWVDDLGKVVNASTEEIANLDFKVTTNPEAPAVRDVVLPTEARDINQDLNTKTKSWLTDNDLPGSVETVYKFYYNQDHIEQEDTNDYRKKMEFLAQCSFAHYLPGTEWLIRYEGELSNIFERAIDLHYNHHSVLMVERILMVLGRKDLLSTIADDDSIDYHMSHADEYLQVCDKPILDRVQEYTEKTISWNGQYYSVDELVENSELTEDLFDELVDAAYNSSNPPKSELRDIEMVRLATRILNV